MDQEVVNILTHNYSSKISDLTAKCVRCSKSVYAVEELKMGSQIFHKACFRCKSCRSVLSKNLACEHENDFYCKSCYGRNFGPNRMISLDLEEDSQSGTAEDQNLNEATRFQPNIVDIYADKNEDTNLDSSKENLNQSGSVFKIVLKKPVSYLNETKPDYGYNQSSQWTKNYFKHSAIGMQHDSSEKVVLIQSNSCFRCNKPVYAVEELRTSNRIFHKLCFKCFSCNKLLEVNNSNEQKGNLYCRSCYSKNFGPKVHVSGQNNGDINDITVGKYEKEEEFRSVLRPQPIKASAFIPYNKPMEEQIDKKIETNVSIKSLANNFNNKHVPDSPNYNTMSSPVIQKSSNKSVQFNQPNSQNSSSRSSIDREPTISHLSHSDIPTFKSALKSSFLKKAPSTEHLTFEEASLKPVKQTVSSGKKKIFAAPEKCTRCKQSVYAAEKVLGGKNLFHSICFKCADCKKVLNLTNYFEHNNEIYCKPCLNGSNYVQIKV